MLNKIPVESQLDLILDLLYKWSNSFSAVKSLIFLDFNSSINVIDVENKLTL